MDIDDELSSVQDIYDNHEVIVESYDMKYTGIRAYFPENKIRSVLKEASRYEDEFKKAAVVLRELPNIHVFQDGNKRTAWLSVVEYLDRLNLEPAKTGDEVERVLKSRKRFDVSELAIWLESGEIDRDRTR